MQHLSQQLHLQKQQQQLDGHGPQGRLQRSPSIGSAPTSPTTVTHPHNNNNTNNNMVPIHMRRGSHGSIQNKPLSPQLQHHQIRKHSQGSITQLQQGLFTGSMYGNGGGGGGGSPLQGMHMPPQIHQHHQHQHVRTSNGPSPGEDGGG